MEYFERRMRERPSIKREWVLRVGENPVKSVTQADGRTKCWGYIEEAKKWLRVVLLPDGETYHNAFFDRNIKL